MGMSALQLSGASSSQDVPARQQKGAVGLQIGRDAGGGSTEQVPYLTIPVRAVRGPYRLCVAESKVAQGDSPIR